MEFLVFLRQNNTYETETFVQNLAFLVLWLL